MSVSHLSTQQKDYQQVASNCLLLPGSAKSITPPGGFLFFFAQVQLTTQTQLATPGSTHTQMFLIDIITFPSLHQHMPTPQGGCPGGDTLDPHSVSKEMTKGDAFFFSRLSFLSYFLPWDVAQTWGLTWTTPYTASPGFYTHHISVTQK